ncbi:MAG: hypothetical protein NXI23_24670 [Bacteroidetes bacterium]|nr:hypothetical protein [Bacteroidota bacterium]
MEKLLLVEAKNHLPNDFLVRQVYYPFRLWRDRVSKKVVNVFMTYSNDVFSFFEYAFVHPTEYNSIQLVRQKRYKIAPEEITMKDLQEILKSIKIREEPKVPFPQADKFNRVVDLLGLLMENDELEKNEITSNYGFDHRQTDYYANA